MQVKNGKTFLDLIAEQIKHTRKKHGASLLGSGLCLRLCGWGGGWYVCACMVVVVGMGRWGQPGRMFSLA